MDGGHGSQSIIQMLWLWGDLKQCPAKEGTTTTAKPIDAMEEGKRDTHRWWWEFCQVESLIGIDLTLSQSLG